MLRLQPPASSNGRRCGLPRLRLALMVAAVVEDAVSAQFADTIQGLAKPTFERFRRTRNAAQYFDPDAPEIVEADATWAIRTASKVVDCIRDVLANGSLALYRSA